MLGGGANICDIEFIVFSDNEKSSGEKELKSVIIPNESYKWDFVL